MVSMSNDTLDKVMTYMVIIAVVSTLVYMLSTIVSATILVETGVSFIGLNANYTTRLNETPTEINLSGNYLSFGFKGWNITGNSSGLLTVLLLNISEGNNRSQTFGHNLTASTYITYQLFGLRSSTQYTTLINTSTVYSNNLSTDGAGYAVVAHTLEAGNYNIMFLNSNISGCISVPYGMFNGSTYVYAQNQTFRFYCLPNQTGCYPRYQNSTRWLSNWTSDGDFDLSVRVNNTQSGYTIRAANSHNNLTTYSLTTSIQTFESSMSPGEEERIWYFVDTRLPFRDYNFQVILEECSL